jgi:integrase
MPLSLRPPRAGKSPNYEIRGKYLGVRIEQSAGTPDKRLAKQIKGQIEGQIERGAHPSQQRKSDCTTTVITFAMATEAYLLASGDPKFLDPIIELKGPNALAHKPITEIDQGLLDRAAAELYPDATPQTRNRQFYTPVSAVLKRAGKKDEIARPKGWRGKKSKSFLYPEQAFALIAAADAIDAEFGLLCTLLNYTGMRISEPLDARLRHLNLDRTNSEGEPEATLYIDDSKNDEPRMVYLPKIVVDKFRAMPPRPYRPSKIKAVAPLRNGESGRSQIGAGWPYLKRDPNSRIFRFHQGGYLHSLLAEAMKNAGLDFPRRQRGFHIFCHTYGTWMMNFGKLDSFGLTRTDRWKDPRSADGYRHTVINYEKRLADIFPVPQTGNVAAQKTETAKRGIDGESFPITA